MKCSTSNDPLQKIPLDMKCYLTNELGPYLYFFSTLAGVLTGLTGSPISILYLWGQRYAMCHTTQSPRRDSLLLYIGKYLPLPSQHGPLCECSKMWL